MKFTCYSHWDQLPESAATLFKQAESGGLFYSRVWFEHVANALDEESMVLACVLDGNKVKAMLPLIKSAGNNYHSLKHRYTTHYSVLLADSEYDQEQQRILACLTRGLVQLPLRSLLLEPVADDDSSMLGLQQGMEAQAYSCERLFRSYNWIYRVQGLSYQQYMAERPARLRNTISRKQRKLEREHGYEIRLFTGTEVPNSMPDYYAAYTASWKANEQYVEFLDGIVESFSRQGWTRLGVLYVKEQPVAAQLWFVLQGKASIFRLAYDEAWKPYSPGSILTSSLMEYVIDTDRVEEIDFLTGNDAYKQDWMSERRQRFALSCVQRPKPISWYEPFVASLSHILKKMRTISGASELK